MGLDRGALAKIDRRVLSGLDHDEHYQMVRVPVSEAVWSTWRRYCVAIGISMGGAISALVQQELRTVINQEGEQLVFLAEVENRLSEREAALDKRERILGERERRLRESERRIRGTPEPRLIPVDVAKVGRNDRCPCGSGLKYKRCCGS